MSQENICNTTAESSYTRVAIVGGGIAGACCASLLSNSFKSRVDVVVFDQGRRGPGGRASHRAVKDGVVVGDDLVDKLALHFDHGLQFFRADSAAMQDLVAGWVAKGFAAEWKGRFGYAGKGSEGAGFFGLPSRKEPVYAGVGGTHSLVRSVLKEAKGVKVNRGVRCAGLRKLEDGQWELLGVHGKAAYHDSAESVASAAGHESLGRFDYVVLTDISSSFGGWHRASAGVPEAFAKRVRNRVRVPLFSAMVAFEESLGLPLDGITFGGEDGLWFAARTQSKPGLDTEHCAECWTCISTPEFAVKEISSTPMQDEKTGAFKPQEDAYLNGAGGPAQALVRAFLRAVAPLRGEGKGGGGGQGDGSDGEGGRGRQEIDEIKQVYLQGQRWGSALPAPTNRAKGTTKIVLSVAYDNSRTIDLVHESPALKETGTKGNEQADRDFVADPSLGLFYCGDFCSNKNPGFEAAALSGHDCASYILYHLKR